MSRILIVDDEKSIRTTLREFLSADGHETVSVGDANEALKLLQRAEFDVVISDIIMPKMSGVQLLTRIRETNPYVQFLLMTGEPTVETASEALRTGASDYLMKPVSKAAVLRSVANAVRVKAIDDERRRLAEVNLQYQHNLEVLVDDRTKELQTSNERLQSAMQEIKDTQQKVIRQERLNALGQMASGIAHDFNNVLMPILGLSSFMVSHPETLDNKQDALASITNIRDAATDAREIVRRLREFYKPGEEPELVPNDLAKLVHQTIHLTEPAWKVQTEAEERHVQVEAVIHDPPIPEVQVDESQIRETLTNLILNAVDAMPDGGSITVSLRTEGEMVLLTVSDTGEGMPEEVLKRCREPFFTTKGEHGTGLGLAMCHGIVQRHRGTLKIESEQGSGTAVTISLPKCKETTASAGRNDDSLCSRKEIKPQHILVIDDEAASCSLIRKYLTSLGHTVDCATSGAEGIEKLDVAQFDIVLTDRAMPAMGGDQVAKAVKRISPDTPVVLLTGFGDMMNYENERPEGVSVVASKPITCEELQDIVSGLSRP
ncbi:MAG: response regulator [Kiritimatiellia bacterium]|jgi:signal transduction histidine kinase|nr:response regulator [Kiritimatiellia bacterium]MDP6847930.1 response regulator [Kiritimatiellia bacterium]